MAHSEHNKSKNNGGFFLILLGALIFIAGPVYLQDAPVLGAAAIVFGFLVGGLGFYIKFIKNRSVKIDGGSR